MATKAKTKSDLLAALHETAAGFEKLGFIDQRQMRKFDALCLEPCLTLMRKRSSRFELVSPSARRSSPRF